jgi:5-methylcytosine-specific restriction endonuclease McrA
MATYNAIYYEANSDKLKASAKIHNSRPEVKVRITAYNNSYKAKAARKSYQKANPDKECAKSMKRHAAKLQRTPPWLTKEHFEEILEFYTIAKELQWLSDKTDPLQVDHIVPLQGKNVSGLHVPWNLQILPASLNASKSNKF